MQQSLRAGDSAFALDKAGSWTALPNTLWDAVRGRDAGLVPFEAGRLRYVLGNGGELQLEHSWRSDVWGRLKGQADGFAIDRIAGLGAVDGQLAVLTPAGALQRANGGVDPDTLLLAVPANPDALETCRVDRVETLDGGEQAVAKAAGSPLRFRCLDGRVFEGQVVGPRDIGALSPVTTDPFLTRTLIKNGSWQWDRVDSRPGQPGALTIRFSDRPLSLDGGRFDIDAYKALSGPFAGRVELVSGKGWWTHPRLDLRLEAGTQDPAANAAEAATAVSADRTDSGERVLCLTAATARQLDGAGRWKVVASCRDTADDGGDPIWRWYATSTGPLAETMSRNGLRLERVIEEGRFSDLIATGIPVDLSRGQLVVPTRVGGILISAGMVTDIFASSGPVLPVRSEMGGMLLFGPQDRIPIEDPTVGSSSAPECVTLPTFLTALPEGTELRKLTRHDRSYLTLSLALGEARADFLIDCDRPRTGQRWAVLADLSAHARLAAHRADWPTQTPVISLSLREGALIVNTGRPMAHAARRPIEGEPLFLGVDAERKSAFLLTSRDLYHVDMKRLITEVATGERDEMRDLPPAADAALHSPPGQDSVIPPKVEHLPEEQPPIPPTESPSTDPDVENRPQVPEPSLEASPDLVISPEITRNVQMALHKLGYDPGKVDGVMGWRTSKALAEWKGDIGSSENLGLTEEEYLRLLQEAGL